jgi:hypothetical protein
MAVVVRNLFVDRAGRTKIERAREHDLPELFNWNFDFADAMLLFFRAELGS